MNDIVTQNDGVVVPVEASAEETTVALFRSMRNALDAALDVMRSDTDPMSCSIGIAAGEIEIGHDPLWGPPLDEASRLVTGQVPGVFVTDAARKLTPVGRYVFGASDRSGPSPVAQLVGLDPSPSPEPTLLLPSAIAAEPEFALVGREDELATLGEALEAVSRGQPREILLGGEAGSGKSRLMREFAATALQFGAAVLYGRCHEGAERPFLPFADAISEHLGRLPDIARETLTESIEDDLAPLLADRLAPSAAPETDHHWMLQAVSTFLTRLAEQQPVVLIVEDVHLAGRPTCALIEHLSKAPRPGRRLMVVTFRDAPSDLDGEVGALIEANTKTSTARRRSLPLLGREEVSALVRATPGAPTDEIGAIVDVLYERGQGNALLTVELWLHLRRSAANRDHSFGVAVPASIVDLATQQLRALPPESRKLVELGATMGTDVDLEMLAQVAGCGIDSLIRRAVPAVDARLLIEDRPGHLRFVHSLVADAVVQSLSLDVRLRHHSSIVRAIEEQPEPDLVLLAHHALSAIPLITADEAIRRSIAAAESAMRSVAFGDAITVLDRALETNVSGMQRAELLLAVGRAAAMGGDATRCVQSCSEAAALARDHNDLDMQRRAALTAGESFWSRTTATTTKAMALLEEAVASTTDVRDRARLLVALTSMSALAGHEERSVECGKEALRLARALDEPNLLLEAVDRNRFRQVTPKNAQSQLELTREAACLAERIDDDRLNVRILVHTLLVLTTVFEPSWMNRDLDRLDRLARQLREPLYLMVNEGFQALRALSEGRLQDAEATIERAEERWPNKTTYGLHMFSIRREQDRLAELRPILEVAARAEGAAAPATWAPGLAVVYVEVGMINKAQSLLNDLVQDDLAPIARDSLLPGALSFLADVATAVSDRGAAESIYGQLLPYEGMLVTFPGVVSYGSADRYLGRLCETIGRSSRARDHLLNAVEMNEQLGWTTWAAHSRYELGRHLVTNSRSLERRAGFDHIRRANRMARKAGLAALERKCRDQLGETSERADSNLLTPRELEVLGALAEGRTNREIGERISASRHTVANHVRAILAKTGSTNRTEAARWAYQRGIVASRPNSEPE